MDGRTSKSAATDLQQFLTASTDPVSAILRRIRVRAIVPRRSAFTAPWAVEFTNGLGGFYAAVRGTMYLTIAGEEPLLLREGDVAVMLRGSDHVVCDPPGTPPRRPEEYLQRHEMRERRGITRVRGEATSVHFAGGFVEVDGLSDAVEQVLPRLVVLKAEEPSLAGSAAPYVSLLEAAEDMHEGRDAVTDLAATLIMLAAIRRALSEMRVSTPGRAAMMLDSHIGPVVKLMCDHPERKWSMQTLADEAGLSRSMFHERFVGIAGEPPMTFLRRLRLDHGRNLIGEGADVGTAARRSGYGSAAAFAAACRREFGQMPGRE